jgi:hypothetical protein
MKDGDIHYSPEDLKRMSKGLERINEENNMEKYVEVDSRKEIENIWKNGECVYWYNKIKKEYIEYKEPLLNVSQKYYKLNPDYCEYKEGQLVAGICDGHCYYGKYEKRYDNGNHSIFVEYNGSINSITVNKVHKIPEAELRTLVPQIFERFIKELTKIAYNDDGNDARQMMRELINKYKGE